MATLSLTTTAAQDAAAQRETAAYNRGAAADAQMTVTAYTKLRIQTLLNEWVDRYATSDRMTKAEQYAKASDADKAAIDVILAKQI